MAVIILNEFLKLLFPQWQGSGANKDLLYGAFEIRDTLLPKNSYEHIDVFIDEELAIKNDILGYDSIILQLKKATDVISNNKPKKIFTIGGDCGVELAPVSYVNKLYNGDLALIWLDAHGDLNTPSSSPSKKFHGMPLRFILGEGDDNIIEQCFSKLTSNQIVLVGCRELDLPEEKYIYDKNIHVLSVNDLKTLIDVVRARGFRNLYIHLDLDIVDPKCFPSVMCPTDNGITLDNLMQSLNLLKNEFNVVGFSVVEYKQSYGEHIEKLRNIIEFGYNL